MKEKKLKNIISSGFSVPKDYFKSLEDNILNRMKEDKIRNLAGDSGFTVPKSYFKELSNHLEEHSSNKETSRVISLDNKVLRYAIGIAATILIMFALTLKFNNKAAFDTLENETVENFIIEEDISSYEIASLLSEEELIEDIYVSHDLIEENLENYLLNTSEIEDFIIE